jgi:methylthioribose-1-phosphate isomerase
MACRVRGATSIEPIADDMAGYVMKLGKVNMVIVGADRICANGDFANKIGTYSIAILAKHHNIPFYVAAPSTSFDFSLSDGSKIPIEERGREEIIRGFGRQTAPENVNIFNPAFDVTENEFVTAFITEKGIIYPPFDRNFKKYFEKN